jgi:hypothetical protein
VAHSDPQFGATSSASTVTKLAVVAPQPRVRIGFAFRMIPFVRVRCQLFVVKLSVDFCLLEK